jgi:hypothetical protein
MPRGYIAQVGDVTVNKNGYEYTRTEHGWVATHILIMEEHLGRRLEPGERVFFRDGHKPPITLDMIELRKHGDKASKAARIAAIEARMEELQAELETLQEEANDKTEQ